MRKEGLLRKSHENLKYELYFFMIKTFSSIALILFTVISSSQELEIVNIAQSTCDNRIDISRIQPRIVSKSIKNDTISIAIGTIANCAGIYNVSAFFENDTVFINYLHGSMSIDTIHKYQIDTIFSQRTNNELLFDSIVKNEIVEIVEVVKMTACACCFEFNFIIVGLSVEPCYLKVNDSELQYFPNKYKILPFMFKMIYGDTINKIDENGRKQGHWDTIYTDRRFDFVRHYKNCKINAYYIDDKAITAVIKWYYPNGELKKRLVFYNYKPEKPEIYNKNGRRIKRSKKRMSFY